jgi:uncharacterized membrane protein HdeD (DUF308 family)
MVATIKEYVEEFWWLLLLQGIATIIFGIAALFMPVLTLATLVLIVSVYAVVIGIIDLVQGFSTIGQKDSSWITLLLGLILIGFGVYLIRNPFLTLHAFIILVGAILAVRGIFDIIASIFFGDVGDHRWLMAIAGVLGIVAGILIWSNPAAGNLAFVWTIGLYALVSGSITIAYALHMKGLFIEIRETLEDAVDKPRGRRMAHGHK